MTKDTSCIRWFESLSIGDVPIVGGKNASLGEMIGNLKAYGIRVPDGFATTAAAYRKFMKANELDAVIATHLSALAHGEAPLDKIGKTIRDLILNAQFPEEIAVAIKDAYRELCRRSKSENVDVAVRSSATAEDLPGASFAGQQETFLNICGEKDLMESCRKCYASLYTDRAITYRHEMGFQHDQVALSIGVQKMVRSDKGSAGVMFSIDTESGFPNAVIINGAWGLGENVVNGSVTPDQFTVFKPLVAQNKMPCQGSHSIAS